MSLVSEGNWPVLMEVESSNWVSVAAAAAEAEEFAAAEELVRA